MFYENNSYAVYQYIQSNFDSNTMEPVSTSSVGSDGPAAEVTNISAELLGVAA